MSQGNIKHKFVCNVPDVPAGWVKPSNWNDEHEIGEIDYIDFNILDGFPQQEGRGQWDAEVGTLQIGLKGGNVNLQLGQEQLIYIYNKSGVDIPDGRLVYFTGVHAQRPTMALADNRVYASSLVTGMTTELIPNMSYGYVTIQGIVHGLDTHDLTAGDRLWLGQNGLYTTTRPVSPLNQVRIGTVLYDNPVDGEIYIYLRPTLILSDMSDVLITSIADDDFLKWDNSTLVWENYKLLNRWDDLRIEPIARTTGANAPVFEKWYDDTAGTSRGVYLYSFDDAVAGSEKEIHFTMQMPHDWNGGEVHIHVHWIGAVADTNATPRWGLEFTWKNIGQVFADTTIIYATGNEQLDTDIIANKHYITEFTTQTPDSTQNGLSTVLIGRLFRNSANAADTYNATGAKCGLLYIDAHYIKDAMGSYLEYQKEP